MISKTTHSANYAVSYQLYSSRKFPPLEAQLPRLKEMGYDAVEPWPGAYEEDPNALRRALDDVGLGCLGFHMQLHGLNTNPERYIEIAQLLGATNMIIPSVPEEERRDSAGFWQGVGGLLRRGAELVEADGIKVLWHNHGFEFELLPDGSRPINRIFEGAGESVGYEIDCGWVVRAGADVVVECARYGERITAIHMKDTAPEGTRREDGWTAIGDGIIDWGPLVSVFRQTCADHVVVEHDNPLDWEEFASKSIQCIKNLGI